MNKITKVITACFLLISLNACMQNVMVQEPQVMQASSAASMAEGNILTAESHPAFHTHSYFSNYTDWVATQLVQNASVDLTTNIIVVTSFGYQGRITGQNHQLSAQLSEHIAHDLQPFGVRTISAYQENDLPYADSTGVILDDETVYELKAFNAPLVLTGVVIPNEHGLIVHAKVFEIETRSLISTAKKFIPFYISKN